MEIITLNLNGARDATKRNKIFNILGSSADIVCLQETHSTHEDRAVWTTLNAGYHWIMSHGKSNARGTALLIHKKHQIIRESVDDVGRLAMAEILVGSTALQVISTYMPNAGSGNIHIQQQKNFLKKMSIFMEPGKKTLVSGDFNLTRSDLDVQGGALVRYSSLRDQLDEFLQIHSLVDFEKDVPQV